MRVVGSKMWRSRKTDNIRIRKSAYLRDRNDKYRERNTEKFSRTHGEIWKLIIRKPGAGTGNSMGKDSEVLENFMLAEMGRVCIKHSGHAKWEYLQFLKGTIFSFTFGYSYILQLLLLFLFSSSLLSPWPSSLDKFLLNLQD